ncbi:MAG: Beta-hydroxyacyl-(acyl-carrier-protein) dehydratase FabA/FabZ [Puniceicoccaceae bacterium 5H]|nr:MAG: Beta-hydroxyacyl-(acyl-carrier-protein) dehydratase FabA/FabZ [Puniceicoccaceae bacterium 5H]
MSSSPADKAADRLRGHPPETLAAYRAYEQTRQPAYLDELVLRILVFLLPEPPEQPVTELPDSTRLREDLGVDSITIAELVFMLEDLFDLTIQNEELVDLATVADLRRFIRQKISESK